MDDYIAKDNPEIYKFKVKNYIRNKEIFGDQFMYVDGEKDENCERRSAGIKE